VALEEYESGFKEGRGMVRERAYSKTGKQSEGAIERGDDGTGYQAAEESRRDGEFRYQPECGRGSVGPKSLRQGADFRGGEAVEEEVSGDEVAGRRGWLPGAGVCMVGTDAGSERAGAANEGAEHSRACINGVDADERVGTQQASSKAAVAVPEDHRLAAMGKISEKGESAAREQGTEGEVFHPAIGTGEEIEVSSQQGSWRLVRLHRARERGWR